VLIREVGALAGIPGVLIHGRNDLGGGAYTAWELARGSANRADHPGR
jgi:proline iminopeptidase